MAEVHQLKGLEDTRCTFNGDKLVNDCKDGFFICTNRKLLRYKYFSDSDHDFENIEAYECSLPDKITAAFYLPKHDVFVAHQYSAGLIFLDNKLEPLSMAQIGRVCQSKSTFYSNILHIGLEVPESKSTALLYFFNRKPVFVHGGQMFYNFNPKSHIGYILDIGNELIKSCKYLPKSNTKTVLDHPLIGAGQLIQTHKLSSGTSKYWVFTDLKSFTIYNRTTNNVYTYVHSNICLVFQQSSHNNNVYYMVDICHEFYQIDVVDSGAACNVVKLSLVPCTSPITCISDTKMHIFLSNPNSGFLVYNKMTKRVGYLRSKDYCDTPIFLGNKLSHVLKTSHGEVIDVMHDGENSMMSMKSGSYKLDVCSKDIALGIHPDDIVLSNSISSIWIDKSFYYQYDHFYIMTKDSEEPSKIRLHLKFKPTNLKITETKNSYFCTFFNAHDIACYRFDKHFKNFETTFQVTWKSDDLISDLEPQGYDMYSPVYVLTVSGCLCELNIRTQTVVLLSSLTGCTKLNRFCDTNLISNNNEVMAINCNPSENSSFKLVLVYQGPIHEIRTISKNQILIKSTENIILSLDNGSCMELPLKSDIKRCSIFNDLIITSSSSEICIIRDSDLGLQLKLSLDNILQCVVDASLNLIFVIASDRLYILKYHSITNEIEQVSNSTVSEIFPNSVDGTLIIDNENGELIYDNRTYNYRSLKQRELPWNEKVDDFMTFKVGDKNFCGCISLCPGLSSMSIYTYDYNYENGYQNFKYIDNIDYLRSCFKHKSHSFLYRSKKSIKIYDLLYLESKTIATLEKQHVSLMWVDENLIDWPQKTIAAKRGQSILKVMGLPQNSLIDYSF